MIFLILIFALILIISGLIFLIKPDLFANFISNNSQNIGLQLSAIILRLFLGIILVIKSSESKFPLVIEYFGWFVILAGIFLMVIGRSRFISIVQWVIENFHSFSRLAGLLACSLGLFLLYAFI